MENIKSLIQNLNSKELEVVKNYINGFSSRPGDEEKKTWKLMEMILKDKRSHSVDEYARTLYNTEKDCKLDKLKSRLKNKILDSLILDINIERKDSFDTIDNACLKISKKILMVKYLIYSHKEPAYIFKLFNEIIELSIRYENYNALIETFHLRKKTAARYDSETDNEISSKIDYYTGCMNHLRKMEDLYYRKIVGSNTGSCKKELAEQISAELKLIEQEYFLFHSPLCEYYKSVIRFCIFQLSNDFMQAEEAARNLIDIIPQNPSVHRKDRIGSAYQCLAEVLASQEKYFQSLEYCLEAQKYISVKSNEYLVCKESEFYAHVNTNNIEDAETCLKFLLQKVPTEQTFKMAKYQYFNACIAFMKKDYQSTYTSLRKHLEINKDKNGWDLAVRILTIQTCIELGYDAEASKYIELLRKQIKRKTASVGNIRKRNQLIIKLLLMLDRKSFNFSLAYSYCKESLEDLNSTEVGINRGFSCPEVICVREWFLNKVESN